MTHDKYDNNILKQLTRIANALDRIAKRLPEECDTAEYAKEHPDWAEKIEKMASYDYVRVTRCKDCRCFIPLEDMKKDPEYKDYQFKAAEKKVRIMEMKNDNLRERLDNMSAQLIIVNDSLVKIYGILELQDKINHINMMTKQ